MRWSRRRFRLLPGGILSKGIVRGYAGALGLDQQDWTDRFLQAYGASGQMIDDDRNWTAFASNVGKARILRREAAEMRLRWIGAGLLLIVVGVAAFFTLRYFGVREGWWHTVLPGHRVSGAFLHAAQSTVRALAAFLADQKLKLSGPATPAQSLNPPLNTNDCRTLHAFAANTPATLPWSDAP